MEKQGTMHTITGGYFLYQILETMCDESKRRGTNNGGITQRNCFKDLMLLGQPNRKIVGDDKTIKEDTSKYKGCKLEPAAWMIFTDDAYKKSFDNRMANEYDVLLNETIAWANKYLNLEGYKDWLGKAILEMFYYDENFSPKETYLRVGTCGERISLEELFNKKIIYIHSLLLGVWHFLVNANIPNDYSAKSKNVKLGVNKKDVQNIGNNNIFDCAIELQEPVIIIESEETDNNEEELQEEFEENTVDDTQEQDNEYEDCASEEAKTVNQILNTPAIINQRAEKIINIGHVDHLEI